MKPFALERYFAYWEFKAPYLLCTSDIQGWKMRDLLALADPESLALWQDLSLGYTEASGHPLLRAEIAGGKSPPLYQTVSAENILCFAGAEEAIYLTMRVLLRPGDHVIVTFPAYQSLYQVAQTLGAEVSLLSLRPQPGPTGLEWNIDLDELRAMFRPNTRLLVVNFPHNPTGALLSPSQWASVVDLARQAGCYLFSDEVYRLLEYHPADRLTAAVDCYDKALSLGVMSKPFGLAGLRVGWVASHDQALLEQLASYKDYTTICNSAPSEILSLIALRARAVVLERSLALLRANLAHVEAFMEAHQPWFEWIPPRAGSLAFPKWLGPSPVDRFCQDLVQSQGVLLLPASVYQSEPSAGPSSRFRIGLGRENLPQALQRLQAFIQQQHDE